MDAPETRPDPEMTVRRIALSDGRYLVFYSFGAGSDDTDDGDKPAAADTVTEG